MKNLSNVIAVTATVILVIHLCVSVFETVDNEKRYLACDPTAYNGMFALNDECNK